MCVCVLCIVRFSGFDSVKRVSARLHHNNTSIHQEIYPGRDNIYKNTGAVHKLLNFISSVRQFIMFPRNNIPP